jgi:hypothetical protein
MKKLLSLSTILLFISSITYAQTGEIKGIVKDKKTGEPIFNVAVYVEVGGVPKGDAANFDGKYTIKPLNPGMYTVTFEVLGYKTVKMENVTITSDQITYINMDLVASAIDLVGFEIIYEDFEKEKDLISIDEPNVQIITMSEMKHDPNIKEPVKMLAQLPRVRVAENGRDVYISGGRPTSTQFITDGIKSITGDIGIPGQAIGSIKVYTGGIPAAYGDVTGGVIVTETKSYFDLAQQY